MGSSCGALRPPMDRVLDAGAGRRARQRSANQRNPTSPVATGPVSSAPSIRHPLLHAREQCARLRRKPGAARADACNAAGASLGSHRVSRSATRATCCDRWRPAGPAGWTGRRARVAAAGSARGRHIRRVPGSTACRAATGGTCATTTCRRGRPSRRAAVARRASALAPLEHRRRKQPRLERRSRDVDVRGVEQRARKRASSRPRRALRAARSRVASTSGPARRRLRRRAPARPLAAAPGRRQRPGRATARRGADAARARPRRTHRSAGRPGC